MSYSANEPRRPVLPAPQDITSLPPDGGPDWNRLIFESSPYLLQHAANPVDWHPWGTAAFERARQEDKPVFLSIGYATCHWCHVMEHETFEDPGAAEVINQHFICIKVDKEERPDIDDIYMTACQLMNGQGGWPLTLFLDHEQRPFFAGTYFPKNSRGGRIGMFELAQRVGQLWRERRQSLLKDADHLTEAVRRSGGVKPGDVIDLSILANAASHLEERYDETHGGFGTAPKFPTPHQLLFLLRHHQRYKEPLALKMVVDSLLAMRRGGIYDHIGFGFHRYSTDAEWLLPHFEKMLYDQALLLMAYLEAFQVTGLPEFAQTAREILTYVQRDMTSPEGGFYSAEDADSEGEEGKFYVWQAAEITAALGEEDGAFFNQIYQIHEKGNFRDEASGLFTRANIPHLSASTAELAARHGMPQSELEARLQQCRQRLFKVRLGRIAPLKDDKILTDWNGLMIAAAAMAARVLAEPAYEALARRAANYLLNTLCDDRGRLLKRSRLGKAGLPAHLDDYAFVIWGLTELYQTAFEPHYLAKALALTDTVTQLFAAQPGGFFFTAQDGERLISRPMKIYDGALPSGNSVMAYNLARLASLTGNPHHEAAAREILKVFSGQVASYPPMSTVLLMAADFLAGPVSEVVICGERGDAAAQQLIDALGRRFTPRCVVLFKDGTAALHELAPFTARQEKLDGKPTFFRCTNHACQQPVHQPEAVLASLET